MDRRSIDRLIVNSPYEEPECYWRYDRKVRTFSLAGGRRPAGYVIASEGSQAFDDPGVFVEIPPGKSNPTPCEGLAGRWLCGSHWHYETIA